MLGRTDWRRYCRAWLAATMVLLVCSLGDDVLARRSPGESETVPLALTQNPIAVSGDDRPAPPSRTLISAPSRARTAPRRPASTAASPGPREVGQWIVSSQPLAASPPVRVHIPSIATTAVIGPLGLNRDGTLEVPSNFSRAGWYTGRPTPGEPGPAIIVAHRASGGGRVPAAFWRLPEVRPGDEVVVTRADGKRVLFVVERLEQHRKSAFPTQAVYGRTAEPVLRLITCGGPHDPSLGDHYRDNVIVFARMTAWAG